MKSIRPFVFFPPLVFIAVALALAITQPQAFVANLNAVNQYLLNWLSPVFSYGAVLFLLTCLAAMWSPLGRVRIGGKDSPRLLTPLNWCLISLCTTTAVGILFWAMAEPISHVMSPPQSLGMAAGSDASVRFAMSTLFLHWSFVPCAIYALPALVFALSFYNLKQPFSLASPFAKILGANRTAKIAVVIDGISLFALVAGMAASLATGVLTLAGGLQHLYGIVSAPPVWIAIGAEIVIAFIASALSGLEKGVTFLSQVNSFFFLFLAFFILTNGPTAQAFSLAKQGLGDFFQYFLGKALFLDFAPQDPWPRAWTVFYWAVWLAWAPVTAAFLGRIGVGYTVRQFLWVNLFLPAVFSIFWMGLFGGVALSVHQMGTLDLVHALKTQGPESLVYQVLGLFPFCGLGDSRILLTAFISYVTAADSNTLAMAGMSSATVSTENSDPPLWIKLVWGGTVGALALCLLCLSGVDGIKSLSYLGGIPALFYEIAVTLVLWRWIAAPEKCGLKVDDSTASKSRRPRFIPKTESLKSGWD